MKQRIDRIMGRLEEALDWGGVKKDVALLAIGGIALLISLFEPHGMREALPFDPAWIAIVLCGIPILCEAVIGLVTEFDITADVLVAIALIASVAIGETFAAGEVAFIMQLGGLLEELTVERASERRHREARPPDAAHGAPHRPPRSRACRPRAGRAVIRPHRRDPGRAGMRRRPSEARPCIRGADRGGERAGG